MRILGLTSRFFLVGLTLSLMLSVLVWGFRQAPHAARQELSRVTGKELQQPKRERHAPKRHQRTPERKHHHLAVDQYPLFPGCAELRDFQERKTCADQKMLRYIYEHVRYPDEARREGIEGMVVIRFSVDQGGRASSPVIAREPHPLLGRAALKAVQQMLQDNPIWEPGQDRGKPAAAQVNLPIKFKNREGNESADPIIPLSE